MRVGSVAADLADETDDQVVLVGWSIGGVLAREAAREQPDPVSRVVTFGTPVVGGPSYTALADRYTDERLAQIRALIEEREQQPIRVPTTAMWSRNDGVVNPVACIDRRSPDVEHVEVGSSHVGMGFDPDVWRTVADRVARASSRRPDEDGPTR